MVQQNITDEDRRQASLCAKCPVCRRARDKQKGLAYWFVKKIENGACPSCQAYEKVFGRKAYEPVPPREG